MSQSARRRLPRVLFRAAGRRRCPRPRTVASAKSVKSGEDVQRNKKHSSTYASRRRRSSSCTVALRRSTRIRRRPPRALKDSLGVEGFVNLDPLTSTVHAVGRTDGY
jgi:hypothetical protein